MKMSSINKLAATGLAANQARGDQRREVGGGRRESPHGLFETGSLKLIPPVSKPLVSSLRSQRPNQAIEHLKGGFAILTKGAIDLLR